MKKRILLLTPPLLQTNTPYPATMHLLGWLKQQGVEAYQCDLSIKVVRDVLLEYGDETTGELLEFLGGNAPLEAKREASKVIERLAEDIRRKVDPDFGFGRYAEKLAQSLPEFGPLEKKIRRRGVIDRPLYRHLRSAIASTRPTEVWITCPFPGTLVGAFKLARYLKRYFPRIRTRLGGGYVNTELRRMTDKRPYRYFDSIEFDSPITEPFVAPDYTGIDWSEYFDIVETDNFVTNLWNCGKWVKLIMAPGCYWHKCAFCDVVLPYIGKFCMPSAKAIVDAMEALRRDVHFVDEAMPPKLVSAVCDEILKRKLDLCWWGNIRFDAAFTPALAKKMAKAGCVCVTGGLECADDRLLKLMNKGITLKGAEKVLAAFKAAKIFVHAYLMYDFPTETKAEQCAAEKYVKGLAKRGLIQSCFWHRFALTVHSPIAREPERYGIRLLPVKTTFACNELDWEYVK